MVSSWIDDLGYAQNQYDDKILFYNTEKLLNGKSVIDHFSRDNKKLFNDKQVEFGCKKGQLNTINQDSFFCIIDGKNKYLGIFDGHG